MNWRCHFQFHAYNERDEHNRVTCTRCGKRQPIQYDTIPDPALAGRQLTRAKTKGQRR